MLLKDAFVIDSVTDDKNVILSYGPCQVCEGVCFAFFSYLYSTAGDAHLYAFLLPFYPSFLLLVLLLSVTGRFNLMSQKNFGRSTAHTILMMEFQHLVGRKLTVA